MTQQTSIAPVAGLLILSVLTAGCGERHFDTSGEKVYPVKGKVLLSSGKPLNAGRVVFLPKKDVGLTATGKIGPDGSFTLTAADGREGAAEGEYKVRVEPDASIYSKQIKNVKTLPFPASYMDEDGDTGLTASVKPSDNQLEPFKLVYVPTAAEARRKD